ncbi:GNAT family N-acetyltransferase [Mucilaginibacter dorajii]|uniref:GNAT family N-acetyltransferase n=1 Tax=Mucilaginibacter dorajii TaxID=692994 RepID=A0ABP7PAH1_9SPHI|nr:GNAT family N-acetyltransferase [Mucilaginibacter dorajii]MCS3735206.1 ribosomal protein S18 acetylase RimI-like enzyme [Mucilaginibacter dorajii]
MQHILDNPIWNALSTGNKAFSIGNDQAQYFKRDVSPFAAIASNSTENFHILYELLPANTVVAVFKPDEMEFPEPWEVIDPIPVLQMVYEQSTPPAVTDIEFTALQDKHIPAMLALTKLTNPGPFFNRTIDFGNYFGIFEGSELIAMTGRRMQPLPYMEVSAVCNHPDHLGKGYASRLIQHQVRLIQADGGIPFLHVKTNNASAIKLYEKLGFVTRKEMCICAIKKV